MKKDKEKIRERLEERRNKILEVAGLIFSKYGFNRANTDDIAKKANLGKGTIYRYFKDKKDLFLSVVDRGLNKLKEEIVSKTDKITDPLKRIETAVRIYLSFFEKNQDFAALLLEEQVTFRERIRECYFEHYYGSLERVKKTFKEGIRQGLIKDVDIEGAIGILTSMLNGLIYMWYVQGKRYKLSEKVPLVLKIFFSGIVKDKERREEYE